MNFKKKGLKKYFYSIFHILITFYDLKRNFIEKKIRSIFE